MSTRSLVSVRDLCVSFENVSEPLRAVDTISFDVNRGEFFVVIGESGSGKSLTGGALVGLQPSSARVTGSIRFDGHEVVGRSERELRRLRGREIGVIYQNPLSAMNPSWTIGDQIAEGVLIHGLGNRRRAAERAVELLDRVRIPDPRRIANSYPHEVSGGMRQRAMIAIALACQPRLLIADEPTTALDVTIKAQIVELLRNLREEMSLTVILITHDMGVVAELADRILVMYAGRITEIGSADTVMGNPAHPYTDALLMSGAISEQPFKAFLPAISGAAPAIDARPPGCRFSSRCRLAQSDCKASEPPLRSIGQSFASCFHPLHDGSAASCL